MIKPVLEAKGKPLTSQHAVIDLLNNVLLWRDRMDRVGAGDLKHPIIRCILDMDGHLLNLAKHENHLSRCPSKGNVAHAASIQKTADAARKTRTASTRLDTAKTAKRSTMMLAMACTSEWTTRKPK